MNNLSLKANRAGEVFTGPIDMGATKITSSYIAADKTDVINNEYIDLRRASNSYGFIPELTGVSTRSGFVVSSSNVFSREFPAWHCSNSGGGEWKIASKENMWIQIKCPELVRIDKFALTG